jgi:AhpD family alkylhydroperoxidase
VTEFRNPNRDLAVSTAFPEAFQQLIGLQKIVTDAATEAGLEPKLVELVRIRASQLNGCAFCMDMHSRAARQKGEDDRRLDVLSAWRETTLFTERERAALALTESMTRLPEFRDVPDDVYDPAAELFDERQLRVLVWTIAVINTFNRFGVTSRATLPSLA